MNLYAVIPTWNRERLLMRAIDTLREQVPWVRDVIVVRGVYPTAKARNQGIAQVPDGAMVLSMDDDMHYDGLLRLEATLARYVLGDTGAIQITRLMPGKCPLPEERRRLHRTPLVWAGAGLLFHKSAWARIDGYPSDYLDDVMFGASLYRVGYKNYRSTLSYGRHDVDTREGGMAEVLQLVGRAAYYPCQPERYLVTGEPCLSKSGCIPNIKNIRPLPELHIMHRSARENAES